MTETIFFAKEPLWAKDGSRTHEHWIQIDKTKERIGITTFCFYFGDEKGIDEMEGSPDLDYLLKKVEKEINNYNMDIETDTTNLILNPPEPKEVVQFT